MENQKIKYKVYDKEDKCIKKVECLNFSQWWISVGYKEGERHSFKNENTDRYILLMWSSLKDKEGIDIYEDDILQLDDRIDMYKVVYEKGCFYARKIDNYSCEQILLNKVNDKAKVIGNINIKQKDNLLLKIISSNKYYQKLKKKLGGDDNEI